MDSKPHNSSDFTLSGGGPFHKALRKLRIHNIKRAAVAALCMTWLPLVIITGIDGTLFSGTQLPFLSDVAMQARVLVALPMLILIQFAIEVRVKAVLIYMIDTLVKEDERDIIRYKVLPRARKLISSGLTELLLLLGLIISTISMVKGGVYGGLEEGTTSWMISADDKDSLSTAGHWAVLISIP